jgi:hypothetical protein
VARSPVAWLRTATSSLWLTGSATARNELDLHPVALPKCIEASGPGTAITVSVPAGGAGAVAALTVWGFQQ